MTLRNAGVCLVFGLSLTLCSCKQEQRGGPRIAVHPIHGEVFVDGKPAKDAFVHLYPDKPHDNPNPNLGVMSQGQVDADGKFEISTYEHGDGAPAGKYKISITWNKASGLTQNQWGGPDRLKGKYADPKKTGFELEVPEQHEGPVIIPRFDLTLDNKSNKSKKK